MAQDLTREETARQIPSRREVARRLIKSEADLAELKIDERKNIKASIKICITCRMHVWTGAPGDCPPTMQLANPFETDWVNEPNAQPYCAKCWQAEEQLMLKMGQQHCAVGPKQRKNIDNAVAAAQANAVAAAIANTTTPPVPQNKTKGTKNKKTKGAKNKKTKGAKNKKNKGAKNKKKLGGVRTSAPTPTPEPLWWWQVCV